MRLGTSWVGFGRLGPLAVLLPQASSVRVAMWVVEGSCQEFKNFVLWREVNASRCELTIACNFHSVALLFAVCCVGGRGWGVVKLGGALALLAGVFVIHCIHSCNRGSIKHTEVVLIAHFILLGAV